MSGLLALLDDVAAIARLAAAQADDVSTMTAKAGAKAVGVVIDDAAVTPKYVTGLPAARELPIIARIAAGSLFNKLVILVPAALALDAFAPRALTPLLMIGGGYLCFEGAEKLRHALHPHPESEAQAAGTLDAARLEAARVKGAVKTDFILSAEIVAISLAAIGEASLAQTALALAAISLVITFGVYGVVAVLVKMDDLGLRMTRGGLAATRALGAGIVRAMPLLLALLGAIGTVAMLWVGGGILVHGLHDLGWPWPYDAIRDLAEAAAPAAGAASSAVRWLVTAAADGVIGLAVGAAVVAVFAVFRR